MLRLALSSPYSSAYGLLPPLPFSGGFAASGAGRGRYVLCQRSGQADRERSYPCHPPPALDPSSDSGKYAHVIQQEAMRLEQALARMTRGG